MSLVNSLGVAAAALSVVILGPLAANASSHREAPAITETPKLDATDFYFFRSYETGRSGYVTVIANYVPLQNPGDGPNYYNLDANAFYDINFDLNGDGKPDIGFRFRFINTQKNIQLDVGNMNVSILLVQAGPVTAAAPTNNLNVQQTYQVSMITYPSSGSPTGAPLTDAATGNIFLTKPMDNIGNKTFPNYAAYAAAYVYNVNLPSNISGCTTGRVFVGQRKDPFVVNLGQTFDLLNIANPIGEQFAKSGKDDLANKNVTSIAIEIPIACIKGVDNVTGAWTTASKMMGTLYTPTAALQQMSRLGNPLVNELVIGLKDKDTFNGSVPANDMQFAEYVTNPTLPTLIQMLFPTLVQAPTQFPRQDLIATFLTGIPSINQPTAYAVTPSEEMRLNLTTPITAAASQNRLGVIASDMAGYPNGRRPGDDVVDITLRVAMGKLYSLAGC